MRVTLSDPVIEVNGWMKSLDIVGSYTLKIRKTPEEIKKEKEEKQKIYGKAVKVDNIRKEHRTCISHNPNDPSTVYFLPGLWPRVKALLESKGIPYELVDKRNPAIRPPLDMSAFDGVEFRENQDVAIALIANSDCGIIETATAFGKSFCISILCKAYPTLNIVVATSSLQVVSTLYEYISKACPGEVGMLGGGKDNTPGKRIICTTLKSLPNIPPDKVQLMFVDECHNVGDCQAGQDIMKFCWCRRFGFSASPVRNDGSAIVMESLFGPSILKMSYQEAADAGMVTPMKYTMLPCSSGPSICSKPDVPDFALKRYSYWDNKWRNGAIKRFVYDLKKVYNGQILIMVSTLEHLISLHTELPWFKTAYYGNVDLKAMRSHFPKEKYPNLDLSQYKMTTKQLDITRNAFAKGTLKYVISTKVFRQGVNFVDLQVLIRADGDVSAIEGIQIPGRLARLSEDKDWAYLVDVWDSFSPWAERRARQRQELYEKQQWKYVTVQEMLDDLGRRPKKDSEEPAGQSDT